MKEQEIVEYLKENKTKGVAFKFMPYEVKEWVETSSIHTPYLIFNGEWEDLAANETVNDKDIIALPGCYFAKQGGWVEFNINDGIFTVKFGTGEEAFTEDFHWWNWQEFLDQASNNDMGFTAFGGWQYSDTYADKDIWYLYPQIYKESIAQRYASYFGKDTDDVKPAIPVRIRFWKEQVK